MSALTAAANIRAPHGYGTSEKGEVQKVAVEATSSASTAVGHTKNDKQVFYTFVSTVDCYIRFGETAAAAATADDWPLKADVKEPYRLTPRERFFTVIRKTGDGVLKWYESEG